MVEDLAIEAKEAAVREVAKLLTLPELLQSIASIKADYITRQQVALVRFVELLVIFAICFDFRLFVAIVVGNISINRYRELFVYLL